jgi:hypothetical protein
MDTSGSRRIFSLQDARDQLPHVKALTADAVQAADRILKKMRRMSADNPAREELEKSLNDVIATWTTGLQQIGAEAKGLWLVDFDNGDGYYCWRYGEDTIGHYHGYTEGFDGRMKIV